LRLTVADQEKDREPKVIEQHVAQRLNFGEGINLKKADDDGQVYEEQSVRIDSTKTTGCRVDLTGPEPRIIVTGKRHATIGKLAEENEAGVSLAEALSKETGRLHLAETKDKEDSNVPDIWLRDAEAGARLPVQVRHFDEVAVRQLGRDREFELEVTCAALANAICAAIADKNMVDAGEAAKTYLLLISPYPLPEVLHAPICSAILYHAPEKKYVQTWVASRREPAFRVQG
jgi:hypothetical protein